MEKSFARGVFCFLEKRALGILADFEGYQKEM